LRLKFGICVWREGEVMIEPRRVDPSGAVFNFDPLLRPSRVELHWRDEQSYKYHSSGLLLDESLVLVLFLSIFLLILSNRVKSAKT